MLSKKMAFSLTSLITIFALAFVVPTAMGEVIGKDFETKLSIANHTATTTPALVSENTLEGTGTVTIKVVFGKRVALPADGATTDGTENEFSLQDIMLVKVKDQSDRNFAPDPAVAATAPVVFTDGTTPSTNMKEYMFTLTGLAPTALSADGTGTGIITVEVKVLKNRVRNNDVDDRVNVAQTPGNSLGYNAEGKLTFTIGPAVSDRPTATIEADTLPAIVLGPTAHPSFSFTVTLSEKPAEFKKDHLDVKNATVDAVVKVSDTKYTVVVSPKYETKDDIEIKVKPFERNEFPRTKSVITGASKVKVNDDSNRKTTYGTSKNLTNKAVIPMGGYLVVAKDKAMSLITDPGNHEHKAADIARRVEAKKRTYNLVAVDLEINLEGFLIRGGTIDLVSPDAGLVISEIMWATDGGSRDRQWIEIMNASGKEIVLGDGTHKLMLYEAGETLPDMTDASNKIVDRVSTLYKGTNHWSIVNKGQSGRTDEVIARAQGGGEGDVDIDIEIVDTDKLVSMERVPNADGTYADGTMDTSWAQSMPPSRNFMDAAGRLFVGSPGASAINPVADAMPEPEPEAPAPIPAAMAADIKITEIMVDTDSGRLPQWIELTSSATGEVSLDGWSMVIDNAIDADVLGGGNAITVDLSGVTLDVSMHEGNLGKGQSALVVAWAAPRKSDNIRMDRVINVGAQLGQTRRYQLLSYKAFRITLVPPQTGAIAAFGDIAGNLHEAWELPMDGRSSLIRHEMDAAKKATMGTDLNGWKLASATDLVTGQESYYGDDEDDGTPGHDSGGPLPVELSHFRPARDKATGAVVITWATQSELNNAGFFIKRSNQRNGEFKVVNPTMIPGAGTTSEKQFYTYTDTTAQPNIVYYYQIEDVSLDGNRQTLTRGIRLKGHIGAAGKLTSTWGELKSSNE